MCRPDQMAQLSPWGAAVLADPNQLAALYDGMLAHHGHELADANPETFHHLLYRDEALPRSKYGNQIRRLADRERGFRVVLARSARPARLNTAVAAWRLVRAAARRIARAGR